MFFGETKFFSQKGDIFAYDNWAFNNTKVKEMLLSTICLLYNTYLSIQKTLYAFFILDYIDY